MRLEVPGKFVDDHLSRELLPWDRVIEEKARTMVIEVSEAEVAELLSDARFYAEEWRYMGSEYRGLGESAARTVLAIEKQLQREEE